MLERLNSYLRLLKVNTVLVVVRTMKIDMRLLHLASIKTTVRMSIYLKLVERLNCRQHHALDDK